MTGFKDAAAKASMNTIQDILSRPRTIPAILSALGIDSFRKSTATKLLEVASIDEIIELIDNKDRDKLIKLIKSADGIDENASKIADGLIDKIGLLKDLLSIMTIKGINNKKYNKTIVISGIRNDEELEELANSNDFNVKDSGKNYDLLVIKDDSLISKTKAQYAKSKNIPIMTRAEFFSKYKKESN